MLNVYEQAIKDEESLKNDRHAFSIKKEALDRAAKELGATVKSVEFNDDPIPSEKRMKEVIEDLRRAYLVALMIKNLPSFIRKVKKGKDGVSYTLNDITNSAASFGEEWTYVVREHFLKIECDEDIKEDCRVVYDDVYVLEWAGEGYDRDGDWSTNLPSKWRFDYWRLPKSIKVFTDAVWKNSKVKSDNYLDFRKIFFACSCGGSPHDSGVFSTEISPYVWSEFSVDADDCHRLTPIKRISWEGREHIREIKLGLAKDGSFIGERVITKSRIYNVL